MPRIDDAVLDSVLYLYPSKDDANEGKRAGGAGFWVSVECEENPAYQHAYVVTNSHVVKKSLGNSRVLRINTADGNYDTFPTEETSWVYHPDADDVAVCPFTPDWGLKFRFVRYANLVTPEIVTALDIGHGNDIVMVSRFMSHDGGKRVNIPALRFGNISMVPREPAITKIGLKQECYVVEGRSLPGASGSPVFVQFSIHDRLLPDGVPMVQKSGPWLLGINAGHFPLVEPEFEWVRDSDGEVLPDEWKVRVNTGMMVVVPAWKLREVLDLPELREQRRLAYENYKKQRDQHLVELDAMGVPQQAKEFLYPELKKKGDG